MSPRGHDWGLGSPHMVRIEGQPLDIGSTSVTARCRRRRSGTGKRKNRHHVDMGTHTLLLLVLRSAKRAEQMGDSRSLCLSSYRGWGPLAILDRASLHACMSWHPHFLHWMWPHIAYTRLENDRYCLDGTKTFFRAIVDGTENNSPPKYSTVQDPGLDWTGLRDSRSSVFRLDNTSRDERGRCTGTSPSCTGRWPKQAICTDRYCICPGRSGLFFHPLAFVPFFPLLLTSSTHPHRHPSTTPVLRRNSVEWH